jgi:hypothetical protein
VFLAGGPGQTNTDITELFAPIVRGFAPDRDILSIAPPSRGGSGVSSCRRRVERPHFRTRPSAPK